MKVLLLTLTVLLFAGLLAGCGEDESGPTEASPEVAATALGGDAYPQWYTVGWQVDGSWIQKIDARTGRGTLVTLIDPAYGGYFGYTFDLDGTIYAFPSFYNNENASVFANIDMTTGAVTPIGDTPDHPYPYIFAGPDIDSHGNLYVTGFTVAPPEDPCNYAWWGGFDLWRVNKATGAMEWVGDTSVGEWSDCIPGSWMDLAFDSQDRLWTTTRNKLFLLDTTDGHVTFVTDVHGVPQDNIPGYECEDDWQYIELMNIAFDENDVLYASAIRGFSPCTEPINCPVLRIDVNTGDATLIGWTWLGTPGGGGQNHGGDIMPQHVTIAHRNPDGQYKEMRIPIEALQGHLAHGDYVPGTVGDPNYPR
ncbi:MAG: hypothetical protein QUU85_03465 [Candidatus Eisenbacteria bacterium]|nr:hypothetical protein [Candidatus Eisenbacteria bacterium]